MLKMNRRPVRSRFGSLAVGVAALALSAVAVSQDSMPDLDIPVPDVKPAEHQLAPAFSPSDMDMEAWMESTERTKRHEMLDKLTGDYDLTIKVWMSGEGSGMPTVSEGEASVEWILNKKHLREDFKGSFMGQPFEGLSTLSYDNYSGQYVSCWVDSMGTAPGIMRGHASMDGGAIILYGTMDEPMMNMRGKTIKAVTRLVDEDTHVFEMHDLHIGEGRTKVMEITYTRKKS